MAFYKHALMILFGAEASAAHREKQVVQFQDLRYQQDTFIVNDCKICAFHFFLLWHLITNDGIYLFFRTVGIPLLYSLNPQFVWRRNHHDLVELQIGSCLEKQSSFFQHIRIIGVTFNPLFVIYCYSWVYQLIQLTKLLSIIKNSR